MAGVTPTYGLRYPELVDPPDGAALGKNLADDVEAELERVDTELAAHQAELDALDYVTASSSVDPNISYASRSLERVGRVVSFDLECTPGIQWPAYSWAITVVPEGFRPTRNTEVLFYDPTGVPYPCMVETSGAVASRKVINAGTTLIGTPMWIQGG